MSVVPAGPWSNILTFELLNWAFDGPYNIAHGTTMTSQTVETLLVGMKESGREVDLLLCYAPDRVRLDAAGHRAEKEGNYHATPEDVETKGLLFPRRFATYFAYADNLTLFWRSGAQSPAIRAASYDAGRKTILDRAAFDDFVAQYEADRAKLADRDKPGRGLTSFPSFDQLDQSYEERFKE